MKSRPILFSAPMVRALLDGSKIQTRRIVKPPRDFYSEYLGRKRDGEVGYFFGDPNSPFYCTVPCPHGQPGDQLWVREAWRTSYLFDQANPKALPDHAPLRYEADCAHVGAWAGCGLSTQGRLRPSMFMPRWASRITLEIVSVRVERLQDISEADAKAEGADPYRLPVHPAREMLRYVDGFNALWESINGAGSWDTNPWVWVIEFRRVE